METDGGPGRRNPGGSSHYCLTGEVEQTTLRKRLGQTLEEEGVVYFTSSVIVPIPLAQAVSPLRELLSEVGACGMTLSVKSYPFPGHSSSVRDLLRRLEPRPCILSTVIITT